MHMEGALVRYNEASRLCAHIARRTKGCWKVDFHMRAPISGLAVIFLPGLTDGLLALDYVQLLDDVLESLDIALIQPLLSSSYHAYGVSSLAVDVGELDELIDFLDTSLGYENTKFVFWGHSTGAQISVMYTQVGRHRNRVVGTFLQGAVSDRDFAEANDDGSMLSKWLRHANGLLRDRPENSEADFMPREAYPEAPISASRFISLFAKGGADDCFSADLSAAQLKNRLGHLHALSAKGRVIFFFSEEDEYVPHPTKKMHELGMRIAAAAGGAKAVFLKGANHAVSSSPDARDEMLDIARNMLDQLRESMEPPCWWKALTWMFKILLAAVAITAAMAAFVILKRVGSSADGIEGSSLDADSDGMLSLGEVAMGVISDPMAVAQNAADGDGDGDLDLDDMMLHAAAAVTVDGDSDGCWTTREVLVGFVVYTTASLPLLLVAIRMAGSRMRETWVQEGRRGYQKEMLQAVAT
eukprot:INCI16186.1.p1 GENE.INCI16186.1~~INCI16186.1.p1  ORF type:complete len:470 (-),score=79.69 INCI16186.1:1726-3135(-)